MSAFGFGANESGPALLVSRSVASLGRARFAAAATLVAALVISSGLFDAFSEAPHPPKATARTALPVIA
ncbi:hypothetical protein [Mycobacteroides sp. CBMA 271]|uniref:hypothetical protein n=1 Tax=Mycobacteroides sp. CBMA 271 TaxID=2606608 RepID=UPI001FB585E1|nr:hypothetical protein [Mycobacteroides sp. CBMA 271]